MTRSFRLGATSYVYPGDLLENIQKLGPLVDDIELVLFDVEGYGCNFPDAEDVAKLQQLASEFNLTYTVHLPMDVRPGNDSLEKARRAIESTRALDPFAIVLHFDGTAVVGSPSLETITAWQYEAQSALTTVLGWVQHPQLICVENLERWNPHLFTEIVTESGVNRCIDVGHLWLDNIDPLPYLDTHLPKTRVIHLHGIDARDHCSLSLAPMNQLSAVLDTIVQTGYAGVVTLEVFEEDDFHSSLAAFSTALESR